MGEIKKMNEKIEFLSRQHIDFRTTEGIKQLIQAVTWRVKVEIADYLHMNIYVRKKRIPEVRRLAKEFGLSTINYDVKEIGWFECWFKRFQVVEKPKRICVKFSDVHGDGTTTMNKDGMDFSKLANPKRKQWCAFDLAAKGSRDYSAKVTFKKKLDGSPELIDMEIIKPEEKR